MIDEPRLTAPEGPAMRAHDDVTADWAGADQAHRGPESVPSFRCSSGDEFDIAISWIPKIRVEAWDVRSGPAIESMPGPS